MTCGEVVRALDRLGEQPPAVERVRRQAGRPARVFRGDLGLVIVRHAVLVAHEVGGARRVVLEAAQQLAPAQALVARGPAVASDPRGQRGLGVVEAAGVLGVERAVVVVVLAAGQELRERGLAVSQRQPLEDLDVHPRSLICYKPAMRAAIVAVVLAGMVAPAAAKDTPKAKKHDKPAKAAKSAKKAKRESTAVSRDHKFKADNMPPGWQWPPSKAMLAQERGCETKLDEAGVTWAPGQADGRIVDAITLPEQQVGGITFVGYSAHPYVMDCQLVLALGEVRADALRASACARSTSAACTAGPRCAFGGTENMLSRHALGIAMDVVSFVDDTGREAVVGRDYKHGDALLLAVEQAVNESGLFRILLTPKNDPKSHSDHFHLEAAIDFTPPDDVATE